MPCSGAIFAPCGKPEKLAKAQSPSSSENMHVYKKQSASSPHALLWLFLLKIDLFSSSCCISLAHQSSWPSVPFHEMNSSLGPSSRVSTLPSISVPIPEFAPSFFSLFLLELLQKDLDTFYLQQGVLTMSSAKHHPNSAVSSLHPDDWVKFAT